jgi:hypothetical protein
MLIFKAVKICYRFFFFELAKKAHDFVVNPSKFLEVGRQPSKANRKCYLDCPARPAILKSHVLCVSKTECVLHIYLVPFQIKVQ